VTYTFEQILFGGSILLFLSIIASKTTGKLGVPALGLFLFIGMMAGADGIIGIRFDDYAIAQIIGTISLIFILFSGGLETPWKEVRPIMNRGIVLSTVGVVISAVLVGWFINLISNFTFLEGFLLGAIISSTDAAAVFSVFRGQSFTLKTELKSLLEFESGSNDPMAFFLVIALMGLINEQVSSVWTFVPYFILNMSVGAIGGFFVAHVMLFLTKRVDLDYDGLYPALTLSLVLFCYAMVTTLNGNGFLAVYVFGVVLGNRRFIHKRALLTFYDGIAWLFQISMFLCLGLLVFPTQLIEVSGIGIVIAIFLIFVARPVSVFMSLAFSKFNIKEKVFISWVGLRGAVPIVFATMLPLNNIEQSGTFFNIVFFTVLISVILQGSTMRFIANSLGLVSEQETELKFPIDLDSSETIKNGMREYVVPKEAWCVGKSVVELSLPKGTLIMYIYRNNHFITPNGATIIEPYDKMLIMTDLKADILSVEGLLLNAPKEA
jgi:potassium/hydrogen antiporter